MFATNVPLESVALKLFTGIEKFETRGDPVFIPAYNFLTHGGVAPAHDQLCLQHGGHWYGGLGLVYGGVRAVCSGVGLVTGDGGGHRLHFALPAFAGQGRFSPRSFGGRRYHHLGCAGHPDSRPAS
ncbi:MAG: hypothetical protein IPO19_13775 [Rhodoferax sp.]|nr:hypothetical protein [Rhodoferax sp.]